MNKVVLIQSTERKTGGGVATTEVMDSKVPMVYTEPDFQANKHPSSAFNSMYEWRYLQII